MQRARSAEAKAERFALILDATAEWFDAVGADLTLDQVAESAGLTRTTLYGYAATREELLVLLTERELTLWFADVDARLRRQRTNAGIARVLADTLLETPRVAPLLALCGTVFERNISPGAALRWKRLLHDQLLVVGATIDAVANAQPGCGARLLLHTYASVTGLHSVAFPPAVAAKAIADGGLDALCIDYSHELRTALNAAAAVLLKPNRKATP